MKTILTGIQNYFKDIFDNFRGRIPEVYDMRLPVYAIVWSVIGAIILQFKVVADVVPILLRSIIFYSVSFIICFPLLKQLRGFFNPRELFSYKTYNIKIKGNQYIPHIIYFLLITLTIPVFLFLLYELGIINPLTDLGVINARAQNLGSRSLNDSQFISNFLGILLVPIEDLVNLAVFVYLYKLLNKKYKCNLVLITLITSLIFGALHIPTWHTVGVILGLGVGYFFQFLTFVLTRNIWLLIWMHLWGDIIALLGMFNRDISLSFNYYIIAISGIIFILGMLYYGIFGVVDKKV